MVFLLHLAEFSPIRFLFYFSSQMRYSLFIGMNVILINEKEMSIGCEHDTDRFLDSLTFVRVLLLLLG